MNTFNLTLPPSGLWLVVNQPFERECGNCLGSGNLGTDDIGFTICPGDVVFCESCGGDKYHKGTGTAKRRLCGMVEVTVSYQSSKIYLCANKRTSERFEADLIRKIVKHHISGTLPPELYAEECPTCEGSGSYTMGMSPCPDCHGTGELRPWGLKEVGDE